jgi:sugar-specific transcriptional regulator TrmB
MGISPKESFEAERRRLSRKLRIFDIAFSTLRRLNRLTLIAMFVAFAVLTLSTIHTQKGFFDKLGELNPIFFIIGWTCFSFFFTGFAMVLILYSIKEVIKKAQAVTMEKAKALEERINQYFMELKDLKGTFTDLRQEITATSRELAVISGQMKVILKDTNE